MRSLDDTPRSEPSHDKLVGRLIQILWKLNRGETLVPSELAKEFGVNVRTIQRDLNQRFAPLGLLADGHGYSLPPSALGKLASADLDRMIDVLDLRSVFPSFDDTILRMLFDARADSPWLMRSGLSPEDPRAYSALFSELAQAVRDARVVSFRYGNKPGKVHDAVRPYRQLRHNGIWYLAATEGQRLKTFALGKISGLLVSNERFERDPATSERLAQSEGIWFGATPAPLGGRRACCGCGRGGLLATSAPGATTT